MRKDDCDGAQDNVRGRDDGVVPGRAPHRRGARDARAVQGQRRRGQVLRGRAGAAQTGHSSRICHT